MWWPACSDDSLFYFLIYLLVWPQCFYGAVFPPWPLCYDRCNVSCHLDLCFVCVLIFMYVCEVFVCLCILIFLYVCELRVLVVSCTISLLLVVSSIVLRAGWQGTETTRGAVRDQSREAGGAGYWRGTFGAWFEREAAACTCHHWASCPDTARPWKPAVCHAEVSLPMQENCAGHAEFVLWCSC